MAITAATADMLFIPRRSFFIEMIPLASVVSLACSGRLCVGTKARKHSGARASIVRSGRKVAPARSCGESIIPEAVARQYARDGNDELQSETRGTKEAASPAARVERNETRGGHYRIHRLVPDVAEFIIGPAEGRTRWLHSGYAPRQLDRRALRAA